MKDDNLKDAKRTVSSNTGSGSRNMGKKGMYDIDYKLSRKLNYYLELHFLHALVGGRELQLASVYM